MPLQASLRRSKVYHASNEIQTSLQNNAYMAAFALTENQRLVGNETSNELAIFVYLLNRNAPKCRYFIILLSLTQDDLFVKKKFLNTFCSRFSSAKIDCRNVSNFLF